ELHNGTLLLNDRPIPFDFTADGLQAAATYTLKSRKYEGTAKVAIMRMAYAKMLPFEGAGSASFSLTPSEFEIEKVEASSGNSKLAGAGKIVNFALPHGDFQYTADVDVQQLASVLRVP